MLVVSINIVSVQAQNYGLPPSEQSKHSAIMQEVLLNKTQDALKQQIQVNQDQHAQDLQIIFLLIAISIGLACALVALIVIFLKNRKWNKKPSNPES